MAEQLLRDGAPRAALLALLDAWEGAGWRLRPALEQDIAAHIFGGQWLSGALAPLDADDSLLRRVAAVPLPEACRADLQRLAHPAPDRLGAALFPVVWSDQRSALRCLRVGWRSQRTGQHRPHDAAFLRAIRLARQWSASGPGAVPGLLDELDWWLEPDLPSGEDIAGGSVGWAAVVAFSSWLLRCPVRSDVVFTGCLEISGQGTRSAPVSDRGLPGKAYAAAQHGGVRTLAFHASHGTHDLDRLAPLRPASLEELLQQTFGEAGLEARRTYARILPEKAAPERRSDAQNRILALLSSSSEPRLLTELEAAVTWDDAWPSALEGVPVTGDLLLQLRDQHLVDSAEGRWILSPDSAERTRIAFSDGLWTDAAHRALAETLADPARRFPHQARRDAKAAAASLAQLAAADLSTALHALDPLGEAVTAILKHLPDSPEGWCLRLIHTSLELPWPIPEVARCLSEQQTQVARLLTLQSLVESLLHLLSALADGLGAVGEADQDALRRRPALGLLAKTASTLARLPAEDALRTQLRAHFRGLGALGSWLSPMNNGLHGAPGLEQLVGPEGEAHASALICTLGPRLLELFQAAVGALRGANIRSHQDRVELVFAEARGEVTLPAVRLRQNPDGRVLLWERGVVQDRPRWWAFSALRQEGPPPAAPLLAPEPVYNHLPQPVARLWRRHQTATAPLERLVATEQLTHTLLRLAWFAGAPDLHSLRQQDQWRMNCRNLLESVLQAEPSPVRAHLLRQQPQLWALLDCIERLQHAPGPLAGWGPLLDQAARYLPGLLAAPWCQGPIRLIGEKAGALWQLTGIGAPIRLSAGPALPAGAVALWDEPGGQLWSLEQFAFLEGEQLWLLREQDRKTETFTSVARAGRDFFQQTRQQARPPRRTAR